MLEGIGPARSAPPRGAAAREPGRVSLEGVCSA